MDSLFLQVSTNIYAPDRWRRAALGDKDSSEAKKLLRQRADSPIPVEIAVSLPVSIAQHRPWDERVRWVDEREYPEILVWLGDAYSVGNAYDEAHAAPGDALRSPHGMFFALKHGDPQHALEFLQTFGPLAWPEPLDSPYAHWVDLNDFWARHQRFLATFALWEQRGNADGLRHAWNSIRERLDEIDRGGAAPFGSLPDFLSRGFKLRLPLPWEFHPDDVAAAVLKPFATEFVRRELILHTQDCRLTWQADENEGQPALRQNRFFVSLWGAIWDLFGRDIGQQRPMLPCRQCGKLFYPRRSDSACCSNRHQSLWSKREYARKQRAKQKIKGRSTSTRSPRKSKKRRTLARLSALKDKTPPAIAARKRKKRKPARKESHNRTAVRKKTRS